MVLLIFLGAVATLCSVVVLGYFVYMYPEGITNYFSEPLSPENPQNYEAEISYSYRTSSILTPFVTTENLDGNTATENNSQEFTTTNTAFPTLTYPVFTETATITITPSITITPTLKEINSQENTAINTANPYVPAATTLQPTLTSTSIQYPSSTLAPSRTPTFTATRYPTFTSTVVTIFPSATEAGEETSTPTNSALPTETISPTNTATASLETTSTPSPTYTPVTPTATNAGPSPTPTIDLSSCSYSNHGYFENELLDLINSLRAEHDLPPLHMQSQLRGAAREHSNDMACNNFVSHTGSNGTTNHDRILAYGYSYSWRGENIYMGWNATPAVAFDWWINSQPHLENILNPNFIHIGIGHSVTGNRNAYTLVFARP